MANLTIVRGTDQTIPITITDSNGTAVNLTGSTVFFTLKKYEDLADSDDSDALIAKDITVHAVPASGQTALVLTDIDSDIAAGEYKYNLKIKDSGGFFSATLPAICEIIENVTKRKT